MLMLNTNQEVGENVYFMVWNMLTNLTIVEIFYLLLLPEQAAIKSKKNQMLKFHDWYLTAIINNY